MQKLTFWAFFKFFFIPLLSPFHTLDPSVLLITCPMVSFIFRTSTRAAVKIFMWNFSCLLQHDNNLQLCLYSNSHSIIVPYNLCSATALMVLPSLAHFHPMTGAILDHQLSTDHIIRCWAALLTWDFIRPLIRCTCCTYHPIPRLLRVKWWCFLVLLSPFVTACFVPDVFKRSSVW